MAPSPLLASRTNDRSIRLPPVIPLQSVHRLGTLRGAEQPRQPSGRLLDGQALERPNQGTSRPLQRPCLGFRRDDRKCIECAASTTRPP